MIEKVNLRVQYQKYVWTDIEKVNLKNSNTLGILILNVQITKSFDLSTTHYQAD